MIWKNNLFDSLDHESCIALVTGAASGIGRATAELLAGRGLVVACADISNEGAKQTAETLPMAAAAIHLDVTEEDNWIEAISWIKQSFGRLDYLINCAGISHAASLAEMSIDDWRRVHGVNLDGAFLGIKHSIPLMREMGGVIVNVASASGIKPAPGAAAYSSSKAALRMLTKVAAKELREFGIRVNSVSPAGVKTEMWESMPFFKDAVSRLGSKEAAFAEMEEQGGARFAEPERVASVIAYLLSKDAKGMTGADLVIDDGYTL